MVKRMTFWEIALAASLLIIGGAFGVAVAKDKLVLPYLPVDHDIEMVRQDNKSNPIVLNATPGSESIILGHVSCIKCREFEQNGTCPDCCIYNSTPTTKKVHCQADDLGCPNPGPLPFDDIAACSETDIFKRSAGCANCTCSKFPEALSTIKTCQKSGCPATTRPNNANCTPGGNDTTWYCPENKIAPYNASVSSNVNVTSCTQYNTFAKAYVASTVDPSFCGGNATANATANSTEECWKYVAKSGFDKCVNKCTAAVADWEAEYYEYNNGTLGRKFCNMGSDCASGVKSLNCNVAKCQEKIGAYGGCAAFTAAKCVKFEQDYQDLLAGKIPAAFKEISPGFQYQFVARAGERYMLGWSILCTVKTGSDIYNLYTKVIVSDQTGKQVYESIVHQKALNSAFFINAQTGLGSDSVKQGQAYTVKLYYYMPNDGETPLRVEVSLLQLLLYRTKN